MREETDRAKLLAFMEALGRRVGSAGRVYLTGGGTAVWHGWRSMTIDVDLKAVPEPAGFFEAIARHGKIDFYHYDLYSQALAKLERSHERDLADVRAMAEGKHIDRTLLRDLFQKIEPDLLRYPAIDGAGFRRRVAEFCGTG